MNNPRTSAHQSLRTPDYNPPPKVHRLLCSRGHMTVLPDGVSEETITHFTCEKDVLVKYTDDKLSPCGHPLAWHEFVDWHETAPSVLEVAEPMRYMIPKGD